MLLWVNTLKRRIETSGYGGRPITGVNLQPVKYGTAASEIVDESWAIDQGRNDS